MILWGFLFSLNPQPSIWDAGDCFSSPLFIPDQEAQPAVSPSHCSEKNIPSPKAHKIPFKLSLIKACNPWDPARLCGFPGGLLLQVSQINNALNQFGLWRPAQNPNFLLGLHFSQLNLPLL